MSKKKVTAPLTYNPGKGRPKEHLAYLNYQEMQALKRLNGEGPYKGPKGLPSFVLGGAKTSGTAANSAMKSASQSSGSRPSSGGRDGGIRDSVGANRPSSSGFSRGDVGGRDSGTRGSVGANRPSSPGVSRGDVAGRDGGIRNVAGANTPDKSAISSANRTNTVSAQKSPAFKADTGRTVNVGPMGTPVNVKAPPGGKIKGAIQSVQEETKRSVVPKATITSPMATQGTSFASPLDARIENFQRINDARLKSGALGPEGVLPVSRIAAENARRLNTVKMTQQYSQYRSPPTGYPTAPQGVYGPRAGVDTRYLGTKDMPGMITTSMTSPYSGTVAPRSNAASTLRAYEEAKRVPGKIQDRVPSGEPSLGRTRGLPSLGDERVLKVENIMSDAGIRKSIPGYAPSRPTVVSGEGYVNPAGVPDSVKRALDAAGYNPDGTKKTPQAKGIVGLSDVVPEEGIPGYGIDPNNIPRGFVPSAKTPASLYGSGYFADSPVSTSTFADPNAVIAPGTVIGNKTGLKGVNYGIVGLDESPVRTKQIYDRILPESQYSGYGSFKPPSAPGKTKSVTEDDITFVSPSGKEFVVTKEQFEMLDPADQKRLSEYNKYPLTSMGTAPVGDMLPGDYENGTSVSPSQEPAAPSQDATITEEAELAQEEARKLAGRARKGTQTVLNLVAPGLGTIVGGGLKALDARTQKLVNDYQAAGMPERKVMEEKYPNLIAHGKAMGINTYYGMDKYNSWAEKSGLRAPPSREGGGENSGIRSLTREPEGDETTTPTPDTPSTTPGRRPDIYYMWDLGVNVPSPSDPNYNQYQTYLAERLAAQRAMG